jgi:hypothetical protein
MRNEPDIPPIDPARHSLEELLRSAQWPDDAADPLDHLLRMAQWPEPVGNSLPDVRRIVRRKRRKKILAAVAAAAAVLFAAVAFRAARHIGDKSASGARPPAAPQARLAADDQPKTASQPLPPREVRLRMILEQVQEKTAADDEAIDRIIARRIAEPDGDLGELVQPLMSRRAEFEQRLLERFNMFLGEREPAAVELLGCLGSETSLPLLKRERSKSSTHAAAVRALLNLADSESLAQLEREEWDAGLRDEVTAALQARDDKQTTASTVIFEKGDQSCLVFQPDSSSRSELF